MMRAVLLSLALFWAGAAQALTPEALKAQGYGVMECLFTERCLIGAPCEPAWRDMRWYLSDAEGLAYREDLGGGLRKGLLMLDARWKDTSRARAIVMPMREAVASHLTVFDGGGAIYALQYAADPGSGQFLRGTCEMVADATAAAPQTCRLEPRCTADAPCPEAAVALTWRRDPRMMRVDDLPVTVTRSNGPLQVETLRIGETDWSVQSKGPALFLTGPDLMGRISPGAVAGEVTATFIDMPRRYEDYPGPRRVFAGQCEGLF